MSTPAKPPAAAPVREVSLTIDGRAVRVPAGTTIWNAARGQGIDIPVLCHSPRLAPVGVCRVCVVDVGERVLAASCLRACEEGMKVTTTTPEIESHRRTLAELLLSDYPDASAREATTGDDLLLDLARRQGVGAIPYPAADGAGPTGAGRGRDDSSRVIAVDHDACILCDRCIRACDDLQHNDVIGRTGKGHAARIAFDLNAPMGTSTCVSCGECASVCPTGALTGKALAGMRVVR
ncbi:MAG: (2Fe-2S)-binding protein [Candidatus Lambdaproteobacteria bacterium]|nr:(2Fe-2S)-binding protein [Candidatus Lambdaproteobacteria bacterium]